MVSAVVIDNSSVAWEDRWAGCQPARTPSTELNLCAKSVREHVGRFGVLIVCEGRLLRLYILVIKPTDSHVTRWRINFFAPWKGEWCKASLGRLRDVVPVNIGDVH